MSARIIVITNGNYFARLILEDFFVKYKGIIAGILVITGDYRGNTGLKALWYVGKETAFPYLIYKLFLIFVFKITQIFRPSVAYSVGKQAAVHGIPVKYLRSVKSTDAIEWVVKHQPDLVVSVSCSQLIGQKILGPALLGGINIHSSLLPKYAGLAPYFWVLSNGEKEAGITVHYMTLKFDEGNILVQNRVHIQSGESAFGLFKRLANEGRTALVKATKMALDGHPGCRQDLSKLLYFSNPSFSDYVKLRQNGHFLVRFRELLDAVRSSHL